MHRLLSIIVSLLLPLLAASAPSAAPCTGPLLITNFKWYNGSHNLDCPLNPDPEMLCYTGKPTAPYGYGPPDYVSFNVLNKATGRSSSCNYQNPGSVPASGQPGKAGTTKCSTGDQSFIFNFAAVQSNGKGGSKKAKLSVTDRYTSCGAATSTTFDLKCTVDAGRNSTCLQKKTQVLLPFK